MKNMDELTVEQTADPLDNWQQMLAALSESTSTSIPLQQQLQQAQHKSAMERYRQRREHSVKARSLYTESGGERAKFRLKKHFRECQTCRKLTCKRMHDLRRHLRRCNKRTRLMQRKQAQAEGTLA